MDLHNPKYVEVMLKLQDDFKNVNGFHTFLTALLKYEFRAATFFTL